MTNRRTLGPGVDTARATDTATPPPAPDRLARTAAGLTALVVPTHPAPTVSAAPDEPTRSVSAPGRRRLALRPAMPPPTTG